MDPIFFAFRAEGGVEKHVMSMYAPLLRRAVSAWLEHPPCKGPKAKVAELFLRATADEGKRRRILSSITPDERDVLRVVRRYGGTIAGPLLALELFARGIARPPHPKDSFARQWERDPACRLMGRLLLLPERGGWYRLSFEGVPYQDRRLVASLTLLPGIESSIEPAPPLPWEPSAPADAPDASRARSPDAVAGDLARTLCVFALIPYAQFSPVPGSEPRTWRALRATIGLRAGGLRAMIPDPPRLFAEILRQCGLLKLDPMDKATVSQSEAETFFALPPLAQARRWAHGWLGSVAWQDGIGMPMGWPWQRRQGAIAQADLVEGRRTIIWALARVAASPVEWLDLETFLSDLQRLTRGQWLPAWPPASLRRPVMSDRGRRHGAWPAEVVCGTLVALGFVEAGESARDGRRRRCFRLTPLGRAVFGAPEVTLPPGAIESWRIPEWAPGPARVTLRVPGSLASFRDRASRDAFIERHDGRPVGELLAIPSAGGYRALTTKLTWHDWTQVWARPGRMEVDEDGTIRGKGIEFTNRACLDRIAGRCGESWRIDASSIRAAMAAGLPPDRIERWFSFATHRAYPLPSLLVQAVHNWTRRTPAHAEIEDAEILHLPAGPAFDAARRHPRLRPYIRSSPAPGWLVLRRGAHGAVMALLHAMGYDVEEGGLPDDPP